jgi:hypothetical protein
MSRIEKSIPALCLAFILLGIGARPSHAQIPRTVFKQEEVKNTLAAIIDNEGHAMVSIHQGKLVAYWSKDGNGGGGGLSVWDISDLRNIKREAVISDTNSKIWNEGHSWGISSDNICMIQAGRTLQAWDMGNVLKPYMKKRIELPGVRNNPYSEVLFYSSWQGGYWYGAATNLGMIIVDARDINNIKYVKTIPTGKLGGFSVGSIHAVGNFLVLSDIDNPGITTMDISDPVNPVVIQTSKKVAIAYTYMFNGGRLYGAGSAPKANTTGNPAVDDARYALMAYDLNVPTKINFIGHSAERGDKGGYVLLQDGYAFAGFSSQGYAKFDLSKPGFPIVSMNKSAHVGSDEDFANPLGNVLMTGNDHGSGSNIFIHDLNPDTVPPKVNFISPGKYAVNQALTSRIGITLTSPVVIEGMADDQFLIAPLNGKPLKGRYVHLACEVNFQPSEDLKPNTTYVVQITGMKDWTGNKMKEVFESRFSTGATVSQEPTNTAFTRHINLLRPMGEKAFLRLTGSNRSFKMLINDNGAFYDLHGKSVPNQDPAGKY